MGLETGPTYPILEAFDMFRSLVVMWSYVIVMLQVIRDSEVGITIICIWMLRFFPIFEENVVSYAKGILCYMKFGNMGSTADRVYVLRLAPRSTPHGDPQSHDILKITAPRNCWRRPRTLYHERFVTMLNFQFFIITLTKHE
jgi:hypothetical protein